MSETNSYRSESKRLASVGRLGKNNPEWPGIPAFITRGIEMKISLERAGTVEARRLLELLAQGATGARLTREAMASLDRLAKR
jgi:hypothetical protein